MLNHLPAAAEGLPSTPQAGGDKSWPHRLSKLFSSCSSGSAASDCAMEAGMGSGQGTPLAAPPLRLSPEELGQPDCLLVGQGWSIPVHRYGCSCGGPARLAGGAGRVYFVLWGGKAEAAGYSGAAGWRRFYTPLPSPSNTVRPALPHCPSCRSVLRQRCDHFRARCDGPFRDSAADRVAVPDHFGEAAVRAFLHYCYNGGLGGARVMFLGLVAL